MFKISKLFNKEKDLPSQAKDLPEANSENIVNNISNWYADRYASTLVQRNLMLIIVLLSLLVVIVSVIIVGNISSTFKIQPFVIEVEDKTGITNVVNPLSDREVTTNEVLNQYWITKYVKARETYSYDSWRYNYLTTVRMLSTPSVYYPFRRFINVSPQSPLALYGERTSTSIIFRSIQFFPPAKNKTGKLTDPQCVIRFTLYPDKGHIKGAVDNKLHKIVTLTYNYKQTKMNETERNENPLGFYITSYRGDIENDSVAVIDTGSK